MAQPKRKAVFTAKPDQLEKIQSHVGAGRYRSSSEFLREAIDEKLERLRRESLAEQVARFCEAVDTTEDDGLIASQAFDEDA
jgi:Arc/MetJ-type ribon-helix-helix transcriptional regulator